MMGTASEKGHYLTFSARTIMFDRATTKNVLPGRAGDIIEKTARPLSRWHPDFQSKFETI